MKHSIKVFNQDSKSLDGLVEVFSAISVCLTIFSLTGACITLSLWPLLMLLVWLWIPGLAIGVSTHELHGLSPMQAELVELYRTLSPESRAHFEISPQTVKDLDNSEIIMIKREIRSLSDAERRKSELDREYAMQPVRENLLASIKEAKQNVVSDITIMRELN